MGVRDVIILSYVAALLRELTSLLQFSTERLLAVLDLKALEDRRSREIKSPVKSYRSRLRPFPYKRKQCDMIETCVAKQPERKLTTLDHKQKK
jgi:hypothetical protein